MKLSGFPLLPRKKAADKRHFGHAFILAGSPGMTGAACLAGEACLKSGAGLVTLGVPKGTQNIVSKKSISELMSLGLRESKAGALSPSAYAGILSFITSRAVNCLAVGPGMGHEAGTAALVHRVVKASPCPLVLDADGLNCFSAEGGSASGGKDGLRELRKHTSPLVLTPHRGEFERLFSEAWPERETKRVALAKKLSRFYDVVLVLKGHRTLVVECGNVYRNLTGNPGMAKGGSGDVLTGILAAFIAQGLRPFEAASWAVYFHGKAGDLAVREKGELSLLPSDLIDALPRAFGGRK